MYPNLLFVFFQVSLSAVGEDRFSKLLQICHNVLASILEVSASLCVCGLMLGHCR